MLTISAEKLRENDDLTPLDAHNSLLILPGDKKVVQEPGFPMDSLYTRGYTRVPHRSGSARWPAREEDGTETLLGAANPMGRDPSRSRSVSRNDYDLDAQSLRRQPTLPVVPDVPLSYRK